jgi:hypothetical protein
MFTPRVAQALRTPRLPYWVSPTLTGATNIGSGYQPIRYTQLTSGLVLLEGWAQVSNTTATTLFTLPNGMRPTQFLLFGIRRNAGVTSQMLDLTIKNTGAVEYGAGATAGDTIILNGISFLSDQIS